ncbi:MAG: nucleotidyltransferase domain-containing protein [bacterium]
MRLKPNQLEIIKKYAIEMFGKDCKIYIFGSRTDNSKKGGDIDIFIETNLDLESIQKKKIKFIVQLIKTLGEQKIDVIIFNPNLMKNLPIYTAAKKEGIRIY